MDSHEDPVARYYRHLDRMMRETPEPDVRPLLGYELKRTGPGVWMYQSATELVPYLVRITLMGNVDTDEWFAAVHLGRLTISSERCFGVDVAERVLKEKLEGFRDIFGRLPNGQSL